MIIGSDAIIITREEATRLLAAADLISAAGPFALNKKLDEVGALDIVSELREAVKEKDTNG